MSQHFRDKYRTRFGREAVTEEICGIIRESALAQKSMPMCHCDGKPWNALAIYINFRSCMCVMVDETGGMDRAVTLLTEEDQTGLTGSTG